MAPRPTAAFETDFRRWLDETTDLTPRTIGDVVSRLKRIRTMADLERVSTERELRIRLLDSEPYMDCAPSVKSQLKRAALYYIEFIEARRSKEQ